MARLVQGRLSNRQLTPLSRTALALLFFLGGLPLTANRAEPLLLPLFVVAWACPGTTAGLVPIFLTGGSLWGSPCGFTTRLFDLNSDVTTR